MTLLTVAASLLWSWAPPSSAPAAHDVPILLRGARVLSPSGDGLLDGRHILIRDGRFAQVSEGRPREVPADVREVDASGLTVIPGLIDLHSHLLLHPYDEAAWEEQVLRESLEFRTIRAVAAARATVQAGFTTLRDLGTEGAGFADVALRDAVARRVMIGPRIFASTRAIVATGCYGPSGFDPRWAVPKGAQEASGPDEARRAVRQQIAAGADWIKFYADYRRRSGDRATPTFSPDEMDAIVDEAHSAGIPVAAHATTAEGALRAIQAGVDTIEHGYELTDAIFEDMRWRGTVLCPTLAASEAMARYAGWRPGMPEPASIRESRESFGRALKAGVTIACGSDVGVFPHGENARELELMVAYGMRPAEALRAATRVAARVLGRGKELGAVEVGFVADLVAVRGDPLHDISTVRHPLIVIKDGRVVVDRRAPASRHGLAE